jgi:hypothetical protein
MAPRKTNDERSVSRTYRAAIRLGEDFITLEETITLPLDASEDDIQQAVDLGWKIFAAQRESADQQIADIRSTVGAPAPITVRDPDSPASDKQRNYIVMLQEDLGWSSDQLAHYAGEQDVDLVTMTKGQASIFIDGLKKLADERQAATPAPRKPAAPAEELHQNGVYANDKQIKALERIANQHSFSLVAEVQERYGVDLEDLTYEQASVLLREWQRPARRTGE